MDWKKVLAKPSSVIIIISLLLVIGLALLALFAQTNNAALIGLIGVIIGSVFGILGTIINAIWLEPVKQQQERENTNTQLRKAIYGEILDIIMTVGPGIKACETHTEKGEMDYLKSTEKHKHVDPASFAVYNSLKRSPVSFYQLDDALDLDEIYTQLSTAKNRFEIFRKTPYVDLGKAKDDCSLMSAQFKRSLITIDRAFRKNEAILKTLRGGVILDEWKDRRQELEKFVGPIRPLSQKRFDPQTGERIKRFDPQTGEPLE